MREEYFVFVSLEPGPEIQLPGRRDELYFRRNLKVFDPGEFDQPRAILRGLDLYGWTILWIDPGVRVLSVDLPPLGFSNAVDFIFPWWLDRNPTQSSPLVVDPSVMLASDTRDARRFLHRWVDAGGGDDPGLVNRTLLTNRAPLSLRFADPRLYGWEEGGRCMVRDYDLAGL